MIPISKPSFDDKEVNAVTEALLSGNVAQGPRVTQLELEFARWIGVDHAVAVSSGTAALHLALLAHDIGPGDEVITSPFTFIASANSILYTGATPIFVDINPTTFNLDPSLLEKAITPHTKAILPVHLYGLMADMDPIRAFAEAHKLIIIEDAAQAHGASYHGRKAGTFGTGAFSLYATKNMTSAEGGLITTNDAVLADRLRSLRAHGSRVRYQHTELGYNFRMTDVHAAIGLVQLAKLPTFNAQRRGNADYLNKRLKTVLTPHEPEGYEHVWHQYTIRVPAGQRSRAEVISFLNHNRIGTGVFYPTPVHRQPVYLERGYTDQLPVAEQLAEEVISLPIHPALSPADLAHIAQTVNSL